MRFQKDLGPIVQPLLYEEIPSSCKNVEKLKTAIH